MLNNEKNILIIIEAIKEILEKNEKIKICHKFNLGRTLQIQFHNGECFNLNIVKLDSKYYIISQFK